MMTFQAQECSRFQEMPKGWEQTTLEYICLPVNKVTPRETPDKPFTYLDITSIDNSTHRIVSPKVYLGIDAPSRARQEVRHGNTLFSTVRTYLKNIAMVPPEFDGEVASTGFCVLNPANGVDYRFIFYFVLNDEFVSKLNPLQRGTSYPAVRDGDVFSQKVLLPPLAEQRRTVAAIETQFTRLDASAAALRRAQANLKRYRASVLKDACEGRLVPTESELSRSEGRDYEPAGILLKRILAERRARWESQVKRRGKYKEPSTPDASDLPELPEGWVWSAIGQCFEVYVGATPRRAREDYWNGAVPWVSSGEVSFNRITSTRESITIEGLKNTSTDLHPAGTVLLGMIGEGRTRGQVAILDIPACNSQNSAAIRVSEAGTSPEFVFYFLRSQYQETRQIGSGNNQPALNKSRVQEILFPLPPLAEQRRIVAEVERRLSVIQQVEATVEASLARAERLRQSILKQAFSGKLVPQDPDDEPASALLERIKAEREAAQASTLSGRGPKPRRAQKARA